jgi:hypothetical protein
MRKKTPDTSKLTRSNVAPYTRGKTESDKTAVVAKTDKPEAPKDVKVKDLKESDGKIDAKFDDVKSGATEHTMANEAPKPGDGPKSATSNEAPVTVEGKGAA